jgi:hypothetical protein
MTQNQKIAYKHATEAYARYSFTSCLHLKEIYLLLTETLIFLLIRGTLLVLFYLVLYSGSLNDILLLKNTFG